MADREQVARIVRWTAAHPRSVLHDVAQERLLEQCVIEIEP